jgi:hypothetical protein
MAKAKTSSFLSLTKSLPRLLLETNMQTSRKQRRESNRIGSHRQGMEWNDMKYNAIDGIRCDADDGRRRYNQSANPIRGHPSIGRRCIIALLRHARIKYGLHVLLDIHSPALLWCELRGIVPETKHAGCVTDLLYFWFDMPFPSNTRGTEERERLNPRKIRTGVPGRANPIQSIRLMDRRDWVAELNWTDSLHTSHTTFCLESIESIRFEAGWMTNRLTRRRSYCVRCVRCVNCALCVYCVLLVAMRKECSRSVSSLPGADWFGSKQAIKSNPSWAGRVKTDGMRPHCFTTTFQITQLQRRIKR